MRNKKRKIQTNDLYNLEEIKSFMKMPAEKKLEFLEETYLSLYKLIPKKAKRIWEKLKTYGF